MRCENRGEKEKEKGETCHKKCQTKLSPIDQSLSLIPWTNQIQINSCLRQFILVRVFIGHFFFVVVWLIDVLTSIFLQQHSIEKCLNLFGCKQKVLTHIFHCRERNASWFEVVRAYGVRGSCLRFQLQSRSSMHQHPVHSDFRHCKSISHNKQCRWRSRA